jgi:hypothetical protein
LFTLAGSVAAQDAIKRLLGPTADYVGQGLKDLAAKAAENLHRVFIRSTALLGPNVDEPGAIPPRVLKDLLLEAPFVEDAVTSEYFSGVLASSRTSDGKDDRGVYFQSMLTRLSTYQIRTHYVLYRGLHDTFAGLGLKLGDAETRIACGVMFPA